MKLRYIFCALIISAYTILSSFSIYGAETEETEWPSPPSINSGCAILIDADTGAILYEKSAYERSFPASVTKIMTALLTIENCNMTDMVTFSYEAAHSYALGDSNIGIWTDEKISVEETLRAILMASANEACYGIGEFISGSESAFVALMNKRAKELGAIDTNFANTNGLHNNNHYTTCYDLAMIGRACFNNSLFTDICSEYVTYTMAPTNKYKTERYLRNSHGLLKNRSNYYEYALGGKTGYTEEAGHTLISFAEKNGVRLICVIMRSTDEYRYKDTISLFEYGYNNFEKTAITNDTLNSFVSDSNNTFVPENFFNTENYSLVLSENLYTLFPIGGNPSKITATCNYTEGSFANITFRYGEHILGSTSIEAVKGNVGVQTNLPMKNKEKGTIKEDMKYRIIDLRILLIVSCVISLLILAIAYLLIMNKTAYGVAKKRDRQRRRRRRSR